MAKPTPKPVATLNSSTGQVTPNASATPASGTGNYGTGGYGSAAQFVAGSGSTAGAGGTGSNAKYNSFEAAAGDVKGGGQKALVELLVRAGELTIPRSGKYPTSSAINSAVQSVMQRAGGAGYADPMQYLVDRISSVPNLLGTPGITGTGSKLAGVTRPYTIDPTTGWWDNQGKAKPQAQDMLRSALEKALGRVPTAAEMQQYQPLLQQMRQAAAKGQFTTTQEITYDEYGRPSYRSKANGENPQDYLVNAVTNAYQQNVQSGKAQAEGDVTSKFLQVASDWGWGLQAQPGAFNPSHTIYQSDGKTLTPAAQAQVAALASGKTTLADVENTFKNQAVAANPYLKQQFDAGLTLKQVADPAIQAIGQVLERPTNTVSVNDPLVQKYLQGDGKGGTMPMYQYESMLKQDPSWQYTDNAKAQFSDLAMNLGKMFGMVG